MCGIAGLLRLDSGAPPVTPHELRALGDRMPWRGPDDEGFLIEGLDGGRRLFGGQATSALTRLEVSGFHSWSLVSSFSAMASMASAPYFRGGLPSIALPDAEAGRSL